MQKLCLLVVFAVLSHEAFGFRIRRQSDNNGAELEDRYGWNRPGRYPNPGQFPWQGPYPPQPYPPQGGWMYPSYPQFPNPQPWQFPGPQNPAFPIYPDRPQFPGGPQTPGQDPTPGVTPGPNPTPDQSTTPSPGGTTTQSLIVQECIRSCPVTPEYNPVCGTNNITYDNAGRLACAQNCGVAVTQLRASRCPPLPTN